MLLEYPAMAEQNSTLERQLRQELAALRHELRRVSDRLRSGSSRELEAQARQLRNNIELTEKDIAGLLKQANSSSGDE